MKILSAIQLRDALQLQHEISDVQVMDNPEIVLLSNVSYKLKNSTFDMLTLTSDKSITHIEFKNCIIDFLVLERLDINSIFLEGCTIKTIVYQSGSVNTFRIANTDKSVESSYGMISFSSGMGKVSNLFMADISINKIYFGVKALNVMIERCELEMLECTKYCQRMLLASLTKGKQFQFHLDANKDNLTIEDCEVAKLDFDSCPTGNVFVNGGFIDEINFRPKSCTSLTIRGVSFFDPRFGNSYPSHRIDKISIGNWSGIKDTTFLFARLKLKKFEVHEINYLNQALFDTITVTEQFTFFDSTLIKCRFHKIDIQDCNISLFNTFLQDCELVSVTWPERHRINEAIDTPRQYQSLREVYRQLKKVSISQHDKIGALEFQTNEMRMHYKHLKYKRYKGLRDWGNFLIVATHQWASDYGQNIFKPLLFLFGFHWLFFGLFSIFQMKIYPTLWAVDWPVTYSMFNNFFITILPTHKAEVSAGSQAVSIWGWLDFLMRIASGYFIFYFIYSSRKYHP